MRFTSGALFCMLLCLTVWATPSLAEPASPDTYGIPALQAIEDAYQRGEIDRAEALIYRAWLVNAPDRLPERFRIPGGKLKCGTTILLQVYEELTAMGREDVVRELRIRPTDLPLIRTTAHFTIHYATSGEDAVSEAYVDVIQEACEVAWTAFHTTYGWQVPPGDGELGGGTDLTDIYVHVMSATIMGKAEAEASVPGEPPYYDYTGFLHVNTNVTNASDRKVTVAHEYMHVVEFGYNASQVNGWWMENSAMMGEEYAYDTINDYRGYLAPWFGQLYLPLWTHNEEWEYGQITWPMYQTEKFTPDLVEDIWDRLKWNYDFFDAPAIDAALAVYGYTLDEAVSELKIWGVYTSYRDDDNHFQEAGNWSSCYYPDLVLDAYPTGEQHPTMTKRPNTLGSSFMALLPEAGNTDNTLVVSFDGPPCTYAVTFFLKKVNVEGHTEYMLQLDANGNGSVSIPDWDLAEWGLMLTTMSFDCPDAMDYAFWVDTEMGSDAVDEPSPGAALARIYPNCPNPVADRTVLSYSLPQRGSVAVRVMDATGRVVRTLHDGEQYPGSYEIMWNRQDDAGRVVPSGVYYAVLHVNGQELTRQLTVLK